MNELSLFTGAGGGILGTKLLGWRHIGYVEFEPYPQKVIRQRIIDGILDDAPIFGDIRAFIDSGCAELYRGITDVISAGFPCQPFSVAGKRKGADDERNMWPATIECIRIIRPKKVLLENVPGLLTAGEKFLIICIEKIRQIGLFGAGDSKQITGSIMRHIFNFTGNRYFGRILGDLAESGYDCRWRCLSAAEVGANHKRNRLWIVAVHKIDSLNTDTDRLGSHRARVNE